MNRETLIQALTDLVGSVGVLHRPEDMLVYDYDASFQTRRPDVVVLPTKADQIPHIAAIAAAHGLPLVARGAGTGLSSGAIAIAGGVLLVLTRLNQITQVDIRNRRAVVQPGVLTLDLVTQLAKQGFTYAPDPSSAKACTIGGNVGTNAGGPHCLAYGVTVNHIKGLTTLLPNGEVITVGGGFLADSLGYDLTSVIVGAEGTLGIATEIVVQLQSLPEATQTLLVIFTSLEDASEAVSGIIGQGIVPTALEMMDGLVCRAVEAAFQAGYPDDAAGVLLIEVEGLADGLSDTMARISDICRSHHAVEIRQATTAHERAALWAGRKGALGSMGRIAPNYYLEDGVVPRHKLPQMMAFVQEMAAKYDLPIGNFFHAGDGNIHPTILFNRRDQAVRDRAHHAAVEIMDKCIALGGTVSGEHGIGLEKQAFMPKLYNADELATMRDLKHCFDPQGNFNPGKIIPPPNGKPSTPIPSSAKPGRDGQLETALAAIVGAAHITPGSDHHSPLPLHFSVQPANVAQVAKLLQLANVRQLPVYPQGGGTRQTLGNQAKTPGLLLDLSRLNRILTHQPGDLTLRVQAGASVAAVNNFLAASGQMLPLDIADAGSTVGGVVAGGALATGWRRLAYGTAGDMLLGAQFVRADGRVIHRGEMVVKNVAGYDLARLQYGALGTLGVLTELIFKLQPLPQTSQGVLATFANWSVAAPFLERLNASPLQPATVAIINPAAAALLGLATTHPACFVRFDGITAAVNRQIKETTRYLADAGALAQTTYTPQTLPALWTALTRFTTLETSMAGLTARFNVRPADVVASAASLDNQYQTAYCFDAALGIGWLKANQPTDALTALTADLRRDYHNVVFIGLPNNLAAQVDSWGTPPSGAALMARLQQTFDPAGILNPGRFVRF